MCVDGLLTPTDRQRSRPLPAAMRLWSPKCTPRAPLGLFRDHIAAPHRNALAPDADPLFTESLSSNPIRPRNQPPLHIRRLSRELDNQTATVASFRVRSQAHIRGDMF